MTKMMTKYTKIKLILLINIISCSVLAGSITTDNPKRERSSNEAMTPNIYKKFEKLQEMIADELYTEARSGLIALTKKNLNGFESASVNHYLGWVDSAQGNFKSASNYLQKAIDTNALPDQSHFSMMYQKSQMLAGSDNYQLALDSLDEYYKVVDVIEDSTLYYEASLYAQMEKYTEAFVTLKKAIELSSDKPKESWYNLLLTCYWQTSQFLQASKVSEILIELNPDKKQYWNQLSQLYFTLKKDEKSLAVLAVADENGMVSEEKDRLQLSKMYQFLSNPYDAGKVLEKGLKDGVIKPSFKRWEDLGNIWFSAAEMDKSLSAYDEASKLSVDGKIDFRRAYIYFDREDWKNAKIALQAAIEKGGLDDKKIGSSWLLLGMVESEVNNISGAIKALKKAKNYPDSRNHAVQWLDHLEKESVREKARIVAEKAIADEKARNEIVD
jgi:tetratricopeptide (TPR) repeat protein